MDAFCSESVLQFLNLLLEKLDGLSMSMHLLLPSSF
jgi:hypothetical protein